MNKSSLKTTVVYLALLTNINGILSSSTPYIKHKTKLLTLKK